LGPFGGVLGSDIAPHEFLLTGYFGLLPVVIFQLLFEQNSFLLDKRAVIACITGKSGGG
jgi:hypothetical protein